MIERFIAISQLMEVQHDKFVRVSIKEQQYRVDLVAAEAPVDTTGDAAVLATIFMTKPADSARLDPTEMTIDLSKWEGQTVRLRFAVGQNQAPLRAGVDEIRFEKLP